MPTLMTSATFDELSRVRTVMTDSMAERNEPSNIFVPWAGSELLDSKRGIYYIGIATDAEYADGEQTYEARLAATESFCARPGRGHAPYWLFLDRLSNEILGAPYHQTQARWGWFNLLKIAVSEGPPKRWPQSLVDGQFEASKAAFKEEMAGLRDSLVVITSGDEYGMVWGTIADKTKWNREDRKGCTYWLHQSETGNTFVHCYHPKYMRMRGIFNSAVNEVIAFAKATLEPFERMPL